jgi:phosphoribosyl 1,2-cyclic phosphodiesterase
VGDRPGAYPALGYRITEGDETICYIPDHEPGLGAPLDDVEPEWISGFELARGAQLLIHDCQYTDGEYPDHVGWGHSPLSDALTFARRTEVERLMLFHHDPLHSDDFLDRFLVKAVDAWESIGGTPDQVEVAAERRELPVGPTREMAAG